MDAVRDLLVPVSSRLPAEITNLQLSQVLPALVGIYVISKILNSLKGSKTVKNVPVLRVIFHPFSLPGALLPSTSWNPGVYYGWVWRYSFYRKQESENVVIAPYLAGSPALHTSNLDVARQVSSGGHRSAFIKPEGASRALLLFGMNLAAAESDTWRRHRRIMGPAFNNKLYELVWSETLATYREMISAEGWENKQSVSVPAIQTLTFKLALLIIGKCGFGFSFTWTEPPTAPDGRMTVQEALRLVADTHLTAIVTPKWIQKLPFKRFKQIRESHQELANFMKEQIAERKAAIHSSEGATLSRSDAFTMLVRANEDEAGKFQLDEQELIGNIYVMLFAGHETTAHTLAATLGFLSVYPEIQEEVLQQILDVVGPSRDPIFEDYGKLNKVLAVFYEALRMFPAGYTLVRQATEDTVIQVPNPPGEEGTTAVPIPKDYVVIVDMIGIQYNPRYFDEPEKFKPSRWYEISTESEAFSAFSVGPRACIGRKFATTEAVAFLTMLLRDWKVEPFLNAGETIEGWKSRVLDAKLVLTLGIKDVPVTFTRRQK